MIRHSIVRDDAAELERALDEALPQADLVLINGGSSRGEEDFNSQLLERRGSFFRHGVKAVPGRPVAFSIVDGKPVINVPGPVAAAYLGGTLVPVRVGLPLVWAAGAPVSQSEGPLGKDGEKAPWV